MPGFGLRLQKLRERLEDRGLDAVVVTQPENRRYLTGFTGAYGTLFIAQDEAILITDFRYLEQAAKEAPQLQVVEALPDALAKELCNLASKSEAKRVAFESHHLPCAEYENWAEAADGFELVPTKDLVEGMRALKDEEELETIKHAVALGDAAFTHIKEIIAPAMTEKQLAWELEVYMRTHGAEGAAFDIIVAGGPNGAMPHAAVSDDSIQVGQPIVIDVGARFEGYHSDLTRTLYLGEPDYRFQEISDVVLKAQLAAEEGIRPGMSGREADALAREIITHAGYGEYFGHGLGHGVGLVVHEKPAAGRTSRDMLHPGMTLTIEPGIYIPGWGGVRIEDLVVIREDGVEILSQATKDPLVKVP